MTFVLRFEVGLKTPVLSGGETREHSREDLLARFNDRCSELLDSSTQGPSFLGVTEGVLLSEEAHSRGYETESWVLDEGLAPHERDWLSQEQVLGLQAYFTDRQSAELAMAWLSSEYRLTGLPEILEEADQDWNATWKASFTGIEVDEGLRVLPPWSEEWTRRESHPLSGRVIAINPGAGFGTGTHETTQLCLKIIHSLGSLEGKTVLDFGSGSGILGIAAALQGARVFCVEVDPLANENAIENARLNGVESMIEFHETIPKSLQGGKVDVLLANILRPILIRFSREIKACLRPRSELVLSGLIESDVAEVIATYQAEGSPFQVVRLEKNEWRALRLIRGES